MYRGPVDYFYSQELERQAEADYRRSEDNDRRLRDMGWINKDEPPIGPDDLDYIRMINNEQK
jgi:hypothetical protein